ncbi:MAG: hypothetical protein JOY62_01460 [Acidobacteriaceae bacterium]|nr:hypothetical protein [Acidobacteriaceae bacterium]MBV9778614.1 hypothetical protein [Acidobacteriaceae bacterium]
MMPQPQFFHPPRLAAWLVTLFAPASEAESILGDLLEESSRIASNSGLDSARSWYWRHALKTIGDLAGDAFRGAPLLIATAVIAGYFLTGFLTRFSEHEVRAFLDARRLYESNPSAYLFWLKFPMLTGRVILCILIGALVGSAVKGREMTAALTLAFVQIFLFVIGVIAGAFSRHHWIHWFLDMLPWNCACWIAIVVGGALVRLARSPEKTQPSAI